MGEEKKILILVRSGGGEKDPIPPPKRARSKNIIFPLKGRGSKNIIFPLPFREGARGRV